MNLLLYHAIGDSYGASFEYSSLAHIERHNSGLYYSKHPRHNIPPGFYTDDTQMALAIAELLVDNERWNAKTIAEKFVEVFKRDPRVGYSGGFYKLLTQITNGKELLARIHGDSDKSGGAMRTTPIGLCGTLGEVEDKTIIQASVTHNSPDGIAAALAASYMVFFFHKDIGEPKDLPLWLAGELDPRWAVPYAGKVKTKGWMSVSAAITAVSRNTSLHNLLLDCINFTGDVDTVAAIALAAASQSSVYQQDINESLIFGLENNHYGRDYINILDTKLSSLFDDL